MIQLEQLLRCNKEEEGASESEGAVLVKFGRWKGMGLPPAEVSPLYATSAGLDLDMLLSCAQPGAALFFRA